VRIAESHPLADLGEPKKLYVTLLALRPHETRRRGPHGNDERGRQHEVAKPRRIFLLRPGYGNSKRSNNFIERNAEGERDHALTGTSSRELPGLRFPKGDEPSAEETIEGQTLARISHQ